MLHKDNCKPIREAIEFLGFGATNTRGFTVTKIPFKSPSGDELKHEDYWENWQQNIMSILQW